MTNKVVPGAGTVCMFCEVVMELEMTNDWLTRASLVSDSRTLAGLCSPSCSMFNYSSRVIIVHSESLSVVVLRP